MRKLTVLLSIVIVFCLASCPTSWRWNAYNPCSAWAEESKDKLDVIVHLADKPGISKTMEVENTDLQYSDTCKICGDAAYMVARIGSWSSSSMWSDLKLLQKNGIKELVIYMNSPGGAAFQGMSMADELRIFKESGISVIMEGRGLIASAAIPVLVSGDHRIASKNTVFLIHPAALQKWGAFTETLKDLESQAKMIKMCQEAYANVVAKNSNLNTQEVLKMMEKDTWITAKEALDMGLVDEIE